ncbi:MAG: PAS domain-containing protein [Rhodothalassiaceae bacterium]
MSFLGRWRGRSHGPADGAFVRALDLSEVRASYPHHPVCRFLDYWTSLADGTAPDRGRFSPAACRRVLPYLVVFDVEGDGEARTLRYRLMGDEVRGLYGDYVAGKRIEEVLKDADLRERRDLLLATLDAGGARFGLRRIPVEARAFQTVLYGLFPFSTDGGAGQIMLVVAPESVEVHDQG